MDCQATWSCSATQCDPLAASESLAPPALVTGVVAYPAQRLGPQPRQDLAVQVLAGAEPVSEWARRHEVSRKFLDQQAHVAQEALSDAFAPSRPADDVRFSLPVTQAWLRQLVLALVLIGHSSYRGVVELLRDRLSYRISLGTVHNMMHSAVAPAQRINHQSNLSRILIGAHDDIFQAADPVRVGIDIPSTFCYWLSREDHRDAATWGIR